MKLKVCFLALSLFGFLPSLLDSSALALEGDVCGKEVDQQCRDMAFIDLPAATYSELLFSIDAFSLQETEVTQGQWFAVMGTNPSFFKQREYCPHEHDAAKGTTLCVNNPVERVSLNDVNAFIAKLNEKFRGKYIFRLPTVLEWEYAKGFDSNLDQEAQTPLEEYTWYSDNAGTRTHSVAQLKPNIYGLYDMIGNVYEYNSFSYNEPYFMGCSINVSKIGCSRASGGIFSDPDTRGLDVGFRLVRAAVWQ